MEFIRFLVLIDMLHISSEKTKGYDLLLTTMLDIQCLLDDRFFEKVKRFSIMLPQDNLRVLQ